MEFKVSAPCAALLALVLSGPVAALDWRLEAEDLRLGALEIERLMVERAAARLVLGPVRYGPERALGSFELRCIDAQLPCRHAALDWSPLEHPPLRFELTLGAPDFRLDGEGLQVVLGAVGDDERHLTAALDLATLPEAARQLLGLSSLEGSVAAVGTLSPGAERIEAEFRDIGLDTPDGRIAAAGLGLDLALQRRDGRVQLQARWAEGEALVGPLWLPPPDTALELRLEARPDADCAWQIDRLTLDQAERLALRLSGRIDPCRGRDGIDAMLGIDRLDLAAAWGLGLESLAEASAGAGLAPAGTLTGAAVLAEGRLQRLQLTLDEGSLSDRAERLAVDGLSLRLDWAQQDARLETRVAWDSAALHRIPLGAAVLEMGGDAQALALRRPLSIPVLGGAVRLETLEWRDWTGEQRDLRLAATLEPIDLAVLTRTLGWVEFGGSLSGRIPGLRFADGVVGLDGGLDLNLFDGQARVGNLSLERPFGTLPALAADLEFERLDLGLLTGAFDIGSMRGRVSGHVRDLRLLNWQPVRFDAWFETLDTGSDRWISQKAVDSLSTLGGGGDAALSGTLLRVFDDFPYRRIGLGCRLERNVCEMRGLETVDSGGFLMIEGRPLPVLDVVGHRKRVDWPQLLSQLRSLIAPG